MSNQDEATRNRPKVKLQSLRQLKREGKDRPEQTVMRRHLVRSFKRWRPKGGWRNS